VTAEASRRAPLRLGDVLDEADVRAGESHDDLPLLSLTKNHGLIPQSQRFHHRVATEDISQYKVVRRGQIVHNPYVLWEGAIHALRNMDAGLVSPVYPVWIVRDGADWQYVDHLLRSKPLLDRYEQLCSGVVRRRRSVSKAAFLGIEIRLPSLEEQQRTARILSTIQAASDRLNASIQAAQNALACLRRETFSAYAGEWLPLGDVTRIASGGTPSRENGRFWNGTIPWVKTGEIDYSVIHGTEEHITEEGLANSSAKVFPAGTLLLAMYGDGVTRGRVAKLGVSAAINQACAAITPGERLSPDFLYQYLAYAYEDLRAMGHGAHQKNLSAALVKTLPVPIPPRADQSKAAKVLEVMDRYIDVRHNLSSKLNSVFSAAVKQLVSPL